MGKPDHRVYILVDEYDLHDESSVPAYATRHLQPIHLHHVDHLKPCSYCHQIYRLRAEWLKSLLRQKPLLQGEYRSEYRAHCPIRLQIHLRESSPKFHHSDLQAPHRSHYPPPQTPYGVSLNHHPYRQYTYPDVYVLRPIHVIL